MWIRDGINQNERGINRVNKVDLIQFILKKKVEGSKEENRVVIIFSWNLLEEEILFYFSYYDYFL